MRRIYIQNKHCPATMYASVRLTREQYKALRTFMRTPDYHSQVGFPGGVRLATIGSGWYRLTCPSEYKTEQKIMDAVRIITKSNHQVAEKQREGKRIQKAHKPNATAFIDGRFVSTQPNLTQIPRAAVPPAPIVQAPKPADPNALARLAAKFGRR
ncbi:hypothetical protein [Burkholderia phage BCSR5]|nr:hypothetical protein [Burkholderia phage BCSR5]